MSALSQTIAGMSSLLSALDAGDTQPVAVRLRARSYELPGDVAGRTVVDAGCGGGRAVAELAEHGARAIGVDLDPEMIAVARQRWPAGDHPPAGPREGGLVPVAARRPQAAAPDHRRAELARRAGRARPHQPDLRRGADVPRRAQG
ncbi:class I SAM-dependent methyltransferase [Trebonia sp.]|uniref:class I SAM-dependent methyltransferase n=1 Tax=Trebonia sp. TaxID=2767075 RepID=UPI00345B80A0